MQLNIFALWYKPCGYYKGFVLNEEKETKCHCCCCYNNSYVSLISRPCWCLIFNL